jgi:hypothetical protein
LHTLPRGRSTLKVSPSDSLPQLQHLLEPITLTPIANLRLQLKGVIEATLSLDLVAFKRVILPEKFQIFVPLLFVFAGFVGHNGAPIDWLYRCLKGISLVLPALPLFLPLLFPLKQTTDNNMLISMFLFRLIQLLIHRPLVLLDKIDLLLKLNLLCLLLFVFTKIVNKIVTLFTLSI